MLCTYIRSYIQHTYIHTYIYTCTHTYIVHKLTHKSPTIYSMFKFTTFFGDCVPTFPVLSHLRCTNKILVVCTHAHTARQPSQPM